MPSNWTFQSVLKNLLRWWICSGPKSSGAQDQSHQPAGCGAASALLSFGGKKTGQGGDASLDNKTGNAESEAGLGTEAAADGASGKKA